MTVVTWDGAALAADRQGMNQDTKFECQKLWTLPNGEIIATAGDFAYGLRLVEWYKAGADPDKYPNRMGDDWGRIVVASHRGCVTYEGYGVAIPVTSKFAAWGSGRDYALGALAMGASARRAVEITSAHCASCGLGVDWAIPRRAGAPVLDPASSPLRRRSDYPGYWLVAEPQNAESAP
jgi:hypothetical protein